jgi:hypothetical protein
MAVIDHFTRWIYAVPVKQTHTAKDIANVFVKKIICQEGIPLEIVSDQDVRFTSQFAKEVYKAMNIKQSLTAPYHPQSDGLSEYAIKMVKNYLRMFVDYWQDDWAALLPFATLTINTHRNDATRTDAFTLSKGRNARLPTTITKNLKEESAQQWIDRFHGNILEAQAAIRIAKEDLIETTAPHQRTATFKIGDRVLVKADHWITGRPNKKLDQKWLGPYVIEKEITPGHTYRLHLPKNRKLNATVNVDRLRPFVPDAHGRPLPRVTLHVRGEEAWTPDDIINSRINENQGAIELLIRWKERPNPESYTWEPYERIKAIAPELIEQWETPPERLRVIMTAVSAFDETTGKHAYFTESEALARYQRAERKNKDAAPRPKKKRQKIILTKQRKK